MGGKLKNRILCTLVPMVAYKKVRGGGLGGIGGGVGYLLNN